MTEPRTAAEAIMEAFYAAGFIEKGSPEDDPEKAYDFQKYLKGYRVVPEAEAAPLDVGALVAAVETWWLNGLDTSGAPAVREHIAGRSKLDAEFIAAAYAEAVKGGVG